MSLVRENTEVIRPPRALWVSFMLGRPLGVPNDAPFQRRVLLAALRLLEAPAGPVLADFPEDAPSDPAAAAGFACPVSFARSTDADDSGAALVSEIDQLAPWHAIAVRRRGRSTVGVSGLDMHAAARFILACLGDRPPPSYRADWPLVAALKRACDDLRTYYYEAAGAQPGNLSPGELQAWFWRDTAAGQVFLALQPVLMRSEDKALRALGRQSLVPRAVQHAMGQ